MQVMLFTKHDCQLCDAIKYELLDLQAEYEFGLKEEFVSPDPSALECEQPRVPFVHIRREGQDTLRFEHPVNQVELRRTIHAEMKCRTERRA